MSAAAAIAVSDAAERRYAEVRRSVSPRAEHLVRACADANCAVGEWQEGEELPQDDEAVSGEADSHEDVYTAAIDADIALLEYIAELERLAGVQPLRVGVAAQLPLLVAGGSL